MYNNGELNRRSNVYNSDCVKLDTLGKIIAHIIIIILLQTKIKMHKIKNHHRESEYISLQIYF